MDTEQTGTRTETTGGFLRRSLSAAGRTAVAGAVGGGIALGGFAVAGMTLAGRLSGSGLFLSASALFVIGALLGFVHGGVLGLLGREEGSPVREAIRDLGRGALYAIPALAVSWLVAGWIAMTTVALFMGEALVMALVAAAWVAGVVALVVTGLRGLRTLRNAYARWPERRAGTLLVGTTFAALLVTFLADRPEIWGLDLQVTETGAVLLALGATLWLAGPLITAGLRMLRTLPGRQPSTGFAGGLGRNLLIGLGVGTALALLAVPFHGPAMGVPVPGSEAGPGAVMVLALSQALVDEVLLRLVLMTGVVWLLLRWHALHREGAALAGVVGVVIIQLALYAPGMMEIGFPGATAALGFAAVHVALPAAVFAVLYWKRGLGTALVADATAVAALVLLV